MFHKHSGCFRAIYILLDFRLLTETRKNYTEEYELIYNSVEVTNLELAKVSTVVQMIKIALLQTIVARLTKI